MSNLTTSFKSARRVSVPIVAVTTPDPAATVATLQVAANGNSICLSWDIVQGLKPLGTSDDAITRNQEAIGKMVGDSQDNIIGNPTGMLVAAMKLPENGIIFMHLANRFMGDPSVVQAIWNLRDRFKQNRRMLVMMGPSIDLPPELAGDVVVFDEPLPDAEQLGEIIDSQYESAELKGEPDARPLAIEAVQGLPAFQAEQVVAMSLTKSGLNIPSLWERKRRQIELTAGLKVMRDPVKFDGIGGVTVIKGFLQQILHGQARPNAIVFIDEIEKFLAGATGQGGGDTSGVSQDQLGTLLAYMQDHAAAGCIFIGPPGSAKSMVAKAAGNEAGVPTIQLDLGGMKGSLVGQSEQNLRSALKVITAVSNGRSLWIATCNGIASLPPELRRRFTLGTFFFDLPSAADRVAIWKIYLSAYNLVPAKCKTIPDDDGWTGAEIRQCCDIAWRLGCTLKDAGAYVVPVSRSAGEQLERLREGAKGRFLSASQAGVYRGAAEHAQATPHKAGRRLVTEEA